MMPDWDAWGDPLVTDFDRDNEEQSPIDWQLRGKFTCKECGKVLATAGGLKCHAYSKHGEEYGASIAATIKASAKEAAQREKASKAAEAKRLADRKARKVILTTDQVDEITQELESLIDMMEPYYSQCDGGKSARDLISRLEAMAEGRALNGGSNV